MKLLCITDLHGGRAMLGRILAHEPSADVILLGGDITNFGTPEQAQEFVARCQTTGRPVLAVAGNCDSPEIDDRLGELGVSLSGRGVVLDGVGFFGVSAMPPWRGDMYELTEAQIAAALRAGHEQTRDAARHVVLSHPPPRDTAVDRTSKGAQVGSLAVRQLIDDLQPALVVCGHIHEGRGIDRVGGTTIVNCGLAHGGSYACVELTGRVQVELRQLTP